MDSVLRKDPFHAFLGGLLGVFLSTSPSHDRSHPGPCSPMFARPSHRGAHADGLDGADLGEQRVLRALHVARFGPTNPRGFRGGFRSTTRGAGRRKRRAPRSRVTEGSSAQLAPESGANSSAKAKRGWCGRFSPFRRVGE